MSKRTLRLMTMALTALMVMAASVVVAGDEVMFGYDFEAGYSQDYKVKYSQEVDFGGFAFSNFMDLEVTEKCVEVQEGGFVMELSFNKVESSRMQFDDMVDDPTSERLTGQAITFKLDANGEVSGVRAVGYIEGWGQIEETVTQITDSWYSYMPNEAIPPGEGWEQEAETEKQDSGIEVTDKSSYEFKEMKKEKGRECAFVQAKLENQLSGTNDTPQGVFDVAGGGKGKMELYYDPASSAIVKVKSRMELKMDLTPQAGGNTVETTVNFSLERELI